MGKSFGFKGVGKFGAIFHLISQAGVNKLQIQQVMTLQLGYGVV